MRRRRYAGGGFSGSETVSLAVERFEDPDGVLHAEEVDDSEPIELEVDVTVEGSYEPGIYTGPWENSHPEYRECEVVEAKCPDPRFEGLTGDEEEKAKVEFWDRLSEPPEPEYDPCEHGRFGRRRRNY
jgi:hypothetical protein